MSKYNRINLYKKRAASFAVRTISMLGQIDFDSDYDKEVNDFYDKLLDIGCEGYGAYEDTMDFSASLADEYLLLSDGIYSAVLTSFYHLWERDIKDLCKRLLRYRPVEKRNKQVTEQMIQDYKYNELKGLLIFCGAEESFFGEVNLLRLVVNTIKHSNGPSAQELSNINSKYYYKLSLLCDSGIGDFQKDDDALMLGIDDLKYFGMVLSTFWTNLGKKIFI